MVHSRNEVTDTSSEPFWYIIMRHNSKNYEHEFIIKKFHDNWRRATNIGRGWSFELVTRIYFFYWHSGWHWHQNSKINYKHCGHHRIWLLWGGDNQTSWYGIYSSLLMSLDIRETVPPAETWLKSSSSISSLSLESVLWTSNELVVLTLWDKKKFDN